MNISTWSGGPLRRRWKSSQISRLREGGFHCSPGKTLLQEKVRARRAPTEYGSERFRPSASARRWVRVPSVCSGLRCFLQGGIRHGDQNVVPDVHARAHRLIAVRRSAGALPFLCHLRRIRICHRRIGLHLSAARSRVLWPAVGAHTPAAAGARDSAAGDAAAAATVGAAAEMPGGADA